MCSQNIYITYIFLWAFDLNLCNKFVIKQEFKSQYVYNKHNTPWKVYAYSIYALVSLYQKSHSFVPLLHQLVRNYRTHTLSMKYSIYMAYIWAYIHRIKLTFLGEKISV